ncbi:mesoderm induction early response protein 2 [Latimeria chalumnae]|nr:PREDICTED: mesoderm induction early response protein 2 [Latimeria chalumnae]|eukprot:XP_005999539.1 PREDICTED: mesoderm induction early response protein 2 [Latimeria chalumnae]
MGSVNHRFNLAELLSQNYSVQEDEEEEEEAQEAEKSLEELEKSFTDTQDSDMPLEELLALYGYEPSDPVSEQDSEGTDLPHHLPDMTLDKDQIAKDLLPGEEEDETQSSADDLTPSVTSHEASDLFPHHIRSNSFVDEEKDSASSSCEDESEEDSIPSNECKKEIMVGPQYQAVIPTLNKHRPNERVYENEDQLLWDPCVLPEKEVKEFLYRAARRTQEENLGELLPESASVKDNEQALYELVKCNFNPEEALRRLHFNVKVINDELCAWSEEECRNFEHGFRVHGKNFHLIQANKVRTRSVGDCVEYYYMWKKSERYDYFTQQTKFGRKKYSLHPGSLDYVSNDLDSGEMESVSRSRSSPPIPSKTSCLSSRFEEDHLMLGNTERLSVGTATCNLESTSESEQTIDYDTAPLGAPERNCHFGSPEVQAGVPPPGACGGDGGSSGSKVNPSAKRLKVDFSLPPPEFNERLPLIPSSVELKSSSVAVTPGQMSLSVTDFSIISITDVNSFLNTHVTCQETVVHSEPLSQ